MEDFIVKSEEISGNYGCYPGSRPVEELIKNGIILLDKWPGPTSHDVSATMKKVLGLSKVGHAGTLDPAVSGVLPLALENACKIMPALQHLDKEYVGIMYLHKNASDSELKSAVRKFVGSIKQTPPVRSAVARRMRTRKVYAFDILERKDRDVLFRIKCEAGTYVRVICHQIGQLIGGAHMKELRRTGVGRFDESMAKKAQDIADAYYYWKENGNEGIRDYMLPVESAVEHLGKIIIKDSAVYSVASGSAVYTGGVSRLSKKIKVDDVVAILTLKGELVALAKANMNSEEIMKRKGLAAKTDRVIIDKKIYPKANN